MKSQGLPINFIVIAALAILILILVVGLVVGGGGAFQRTLSPSAARSNCETFCSRIQTHASREDSTDYPAIGESVTTLNGHNLFCAEQDIEGLEADSTCEDLGIICRVTFRDGITREVGCPE